MVLNPTPPPVTVTPPTNLTAKWVDGADGSLIQVTWGSLVTLMDWWGTRLPGDNQCEWQLATCTCV